MLNEAKNLEAEARATRPRPISGGPFRPRPRPKIIMTK